METFLKTTFGRIATRLGAVAIGGLAFVAVKLGVVIDPESLPIIQAGIEALSAAVMLGAYAVIHRMIKGKAEKPDG